MRRKARTTLEINEDLLERAMAAARYETKTATVEEGLRLILVREGAERLTQLEALPPLVAPE